MAWCVWLDSGPNLDSGNARPFFTEYITETIGSVGRLAAGKELAAAGHRHGDGRCYGAGRARRQKTLSSYSSHV